MLFNKTSNFGLFYYVVLLIFSLRAVGFQIQVFKLRSTLLKRFLLRHVLTSVSSHRLLHPNHCCYLMIICLCFGKTSLTPLNFHNFCRYPPMLKKALTQVYQNLVFSHFAHFVQKILRNANFTPDSKITPFPKRRVVLW